MKIGYIRVSTQEQNTIRQEVLMQELGVDLHRPYERKEYQPSRAATNDGVRSPGGHRDCGIHQPLRQEYP